MALLRIEKLKDLRKQSEDSLRQARDAHKFAVDLGDRPAIAVAKQAIDKADAALGQIRLALRKEQGNLVRINTVLDQKDKIDVTPPSQRVLVRKVRNPMQLPMGTWLRYVKSDRAGLIMDALEKGKGDLDEAIDYLDGQIIKHGGNMVSESALSFLEGLRTSYIAAGAEYRRANKEGGKRVSIESEALMQAMIDGSGKHKWPGPKNPKPQNRLENPLDWRAQRRDKMLSVLAETPNDLSATYSRLQHDQKARAAANAEHYLRGAFAYWDFLGKDGTK